MRKACVLFGLAYFVAVVTPNPKRFIFPQNPFGGSSGSGGYHACTPSQLYCNLKCPGGYVKGPGGCDFCMCNQHVPITAMTQTKTTSLMTSTVGTFTPSTPRAPSTASPLQASTSTKICSNIAEECRIRCGDKGYLVDPTDCSYCICKINQGR